MMELLFQMVVPLTIAVVALWAMTRRVDVYGALVEGAGEGLGVLVKIIPAMVGLLTAVYMLRASGLLEAPVSYTHLDVYKRQVLLLASSSFVSPCGSFRVLPTPFRGKKAKKSPVILTDTGDFCRLLDRKG